MKRVLLALLVLALVPGLSGCLTTRLLADEIARSTVSPDNVTGIRGERADYREAVIAFAKENADLMDDVVAAMEALDPAPRSVILECSDGGKMVLTAHGWSGGEWLIDDKRLYDILSGTLLDSIFAYESGWIFGTDYSSGFLDVGNYYDLQYRVPDPLSEGGWQALGDGWTAESHAAGSDTYYYFEQIDDHLYYSFTAWF